jgi:DNA-binding response OmpR family regulator
MADILLVDDSTDVQRAVYAALGREHSLRWAQTIGEASDRLDETLNAPDLVLLDIDLPDGDGLEFLYKAAARFEASKTSVILISATNTSIARTKAFEFGAIDYIPKPFDLPELMTRVRARLRMRTASAAPAPAVLKLGGLSIDLGRQMAFEGPDLKPLHLTPVEMRLLVLLAQADGEAVPRKRILETVWGPGQHVSARCVDHHVCGLRKKVLPTGHRVESIYGLGYRLTDE